MNEFFIDVHDFDSSQLPENARDPSTDAFKDAVIEWYARKLEILGGAAIVGIDDEKIHVQFAPSGEFPDPLERAIELLQGGQLEEGVSMLETLVALDPNELNVRLNLGMALSDLGRLGDAARHLERSIKLNPANPVPWIALGVAQQRMGDATQAMESLRKASDLDPSNGYAHRNLGAILMNSGRSEEAGSHLRQAYELLPNDPQAAFGYASWIIDEAPDQTSEADDILQELIGSLPGSHPLVELSKTARSKIAMLNLRAAGGPVRMDAVMYLVGAIDRFKALPRIKVQEIGFEVAMKGQRGLDVNDSAPKYTLVSLPGNFSGLHLMCLMFAAFKVIEPSMDIGFDLSKEYEVAQTMAKGTNQ